LREKIGFNQKRSVYLNYIEKHYNPLILTDIIERSPPAASPLGKVSCYVSSVEKLQLIDRVIELVATPLTLAPIVLNNSHEPY
jgi:hypothetical protein